jgi:hypothetical protein
VGAVVIRPDPELASRLTTRASLGSSPSTPVHVDEARWVLGRELAEPADAVDGWAPWSSWVAVIGAAPPAQPEEYLTTDQAAARLRVDRDTLDAMFARSPKDLPGSPTHVGRGKVRRHLRWPAAGLTAWAAAYREWERTRGRR